jgi:hypothetical protein
MNATMITCPNCGTGIPLSDALAEQFRHENEARLKVLAGQVEQKARADFAVEKQFLEVQLAEERRKCQEAQQAELELRKEREAVKPTAASLTSKWLAASTARSNVRPNSRTSGSRKRTG